MKNPSLKLVFNPPSFNLAYRSLLKTVNDTANN